MGIIPAMKTEETKTPETTKKKIIKLSRMANNYIWMSSGFNSEFYNDPDVKKAMVDAFGRVKQVKLLIGGDVEERKSEVGWIFEAAEKFKEKLRIRQCESVPHWLIIDGKHFRLERPHPMGAVGVDNLVVYNVDPPAISEILRQRFDKWWGSATPVNP